MQMFKCFNLFWYAKKSNIISNHLHVYNMSCIPKREPTCDYAQGKYRDIATNFAVCGSV